MGDGLADLDVPVELVVDQNPKLDLKNTGRVGEVTFFLVGGWELYLKLSARIFNRAALQKIAQMKSGFIHKKPIIN